MEKKTKIVRDAIAAFTQKYEELPADAGWPVVKQWGKDVYFARSLKEWKSYKINQILTALLFYSVMLLTLGIIGLVVFGYYKIALYCAFACLVAFASTIFLSKQNGSEIRFYCSNDGKIHRIAT